MLSVQASQAAVTITLNPTSGAASTNKLHLILGMKIVGFAAIDAVEQAVEAEPDVIFAEAPVAVPVTKAAFLVEFALHAAKWLSHEVSLCLLAGELTPVVLRAPYFRNPD